MTERDEHPLRADRPSADGRSPAESLSDRAYRELEELIVTLQLIPGEVLSEAALTARLGIGRTPVREALQRLAYEGLVTILPRRGVIVTEINVSRHLALLETRRELERLIMRSAAKRATKAERAVFADLAQGFADAAARSDDVTFMRLDRRFNAATIAACRNEYAARAMASMQGLSRRFWYQHYRETLDLKRSAELHQAVAQAIADGDPTAAAAASDALVDHIAEFARATI